MSATRNLADLAQCFEADRRHLRSVAFGLLGSVADADDAVQSAWLKASRSDFDAVNNLTGWFTTITAHEAFDQLRVRKRRAEQPLEDLDRLAPAVSVPADDDALLADSVSRALLVVLDRLSPAQRVAFRPARCLRGALRNDRRPVGPVTGCGEEARKPGTGAAARRCGR